MNKKTILFVLGFIFTLLIGLNIIFPIICGSSQVLVVLSGSMHPLMRVGDMAVINSADANEIQQGDVICFTGPGNNPDIMITHRVVSIKDNGELIFQTKGDANEEKDDYVVPASKLVGKLVFVIPFAGYLPEVTNNSGVFLLTIILPALLLIWGEIKNVFRYSDPIKARKMERDEKKRVKEYPHIVKGKRLIGTVLLSLAILMILTLPHGYNNGYTSMDAGEHTLTNKGFLPEVVVFTPQDDTQKSSIEPWYMVNEVGNENKVNINAATDTAITSVPYILPVFWIIAMAKINPYLPLAAIIALYTIIILLVLFPYWCQKPNRMNNKETKYALKLLARKFKMKL